MNYLLTATSESWNWPYWGIMVTINSISFIIMIYLFIKTFLDNKKHPENSKYRTTLAVLGLIYCSVALYRSAFISSYTGRKAWFDSIANSMFVIRCLANFAEVSFACLVGFCLMHLNKQVALPDYIKENSWQEKYLKFSPWLVIICLTVAQCFAWSGLLTQYIVLFAIEETLWTLGFVFIAPLVIIQTINLFKTRKTESNLKYFRAFVMVLCIFTVGYVLFQVVYQLPFGYYLEIASDLESGIHYGFNLESLNRIIYDYNEVRGFDEWGGIGFFLWHSGYFSICVWMVLLFASGPRLIETGLDRTNK